ncbi:PITH domain-containing protein 1 [Grifola frondosa]|uniref:PITH domain-containing protein 1 n=1 Tax=Grifola frondosa TaxID=5627 RepID=A0A1C7LSH4_GRIFR|nr:PITH domain-containing protein 1 [Grifola frondosa]
MTPRHLRIYANHTNIVDFSEAEETTPQLNISLLEGEIGVMEYPLRSAAFANIHSLSLFFSDAVGGEALRLYYIGFKGDSRTQRKEGIQKLEIPAANAADASLTDRLTEKSGGQQTTAR